MRLFDITLKQYVENFKISSFDGFYHGNIDRLELKFQASDDMHNYYFQYDGLNRLTDAQYGSVTPNVGIMSNAYRVSSKYDKHGNILCLSRSGLLLPVAPKSRIIGGEDSGGGSGSSSDHYYLKDHQGNNRVVLNQFNIAEQVNHYYPFGSLFGMSKEGSFQPYKLGGKELERVGGLDLYDFEARQYDPVLGRFTSMDPHCEKYYSHSPYGYCNSNPINRVDPDGKDWFQNIYTGSIYYNSSYRMWDVYLIEGEGWE